MAKPNKKHRKITAAVHMSEDDLRNALEDVLDSDICYAVVGMGSSESGYFGDDEFFDMATFCDAFLSDDDPLSVAQEFWDGDDLDEHENHANPYAEYARYHYGTIETTDYPGDVYLENLSDEIIDYIVEHPDPYEPYPDEVQELLDDYHDLNAELDEDEDEDSGGEE